MPEKNSQIQVGEENKAISATEMEEQLSNSGTRIYSGYIQEEYNSKFYGYNKFKTFDEMYNDSTVRQITHAIEVSKTKAEYFVDAYKDKDGKISPQAEEHRDFVEKAFFENLNMKRRDFVRHITVNIRYGVSVFEKGLYFKDGLYWPQVRYRNPRTILRWETENGENGITQYLFEPVEDGLNEGKTQVSIPGNKLIIFTFDQEGDNYEGRSVYRRIGKDWMYKTKFENFRAVKNEKESVGVVKVIVPMGANDALKKQALENGANIRSDAKGAVFVEQNAEGKRLIDYEFMDYTKVSNNSTTLAEDIEKYKQNIIDSFFAKFLYLGSSKTGSFGLGESAMGFFHSAIQSLITDDLEKINEYLVKWIIDLNFDNVEGYPKIRVGNIGKSNMDIFAKSIQSLSGSGMLTKTLDTENFVRKATQIPEISEEEFEEKKNMVQEGQGAKKSKEAEEGEEGEEEENFSCCGGKDDFHIQYFDEQTIIDIQNGTMSVDVKKKINKKNAYQSQSPREMTFAEKQVNFSLMKDETNKSKEKIDQGIDEVTEKQKADLANQIKKFVKNGDIKQLQEISVKYGPEIAELITEEQKKIFDLGKNEASKELNVPISPTNQDVRGALKTQNQITAKRYVDQLDFTTQSTIMGVVNKTGQSLPAVSAATLIDAVFEQLDKNIAKMKGGLSTSSVGSALNTGRNSVVQRHPEKIYAAQYSAILDDRTTIRCMSLDGRVVKVGSSDYNAYSPPQHFDCRSIRVYILKDEIFKPKITGVPKSIPVKTSITSQETLKNPKVLKNSPAAKNIIKQQNRGVFPTEKK